MTGARINITPRPEWSPTPRDRRTEPQEHRCGRCFGPFGKSAIRCPNEPKSTGNQEGTQQ